MAGTCCSSIVWASSSSCSALGSACVVPAGMTAPTTSNRSGPRKYPNTSWFGPASAGCRGRRTGSARPPSSACARRPWHRPGTRRRRVEAGHLIDEEIGDALGGGSHARVGEEVRVAAPSPSSCSVSTASMAANVGTCVLLRRIDRLGQPLLEAGAVGDQYVGVPHRRERNGDAWNSWEATPAA